MKIANQKQEKILEHILSLLYSLSPKAIFTSHISKEVARDEEFTKKLLLRLKEKGLVSEVKKNMKGVFYRRRSRWRLSEQAYTAYKISASK